MAKLKGIKAAMPFMIGPALYTWCGNAVKKPEKVCDLLTPLKHIEPGADDWGSYGLVEPLEEGQYVHNLDGAAYMLAVKFSEKVLPKTVRDKEINERVKDFVERHGRAVTKQEFAQIRDDAEAALLPKAFVRDAVIPILVYKDMIVYCGTQARKVDAMQGLIMKLADQRKISLDAHSITTVNSIPFMLTELAKDGVYDPGEDFDHHLSADTSGVFKREDKATARIKDRDLSHNDVQKLFDNAYSATELGIELVSQELDTGVCKFTFSDKWVIKGIKLTDKDEMRTHADAHATYWLYAFYVRNIVKVLVAALNDGEPASGDPDEL